MDAWHNFNSEMQRKQAFLIDKIRDAGNHLDSIRESNRMSMTLHFINDSDLLNNGLKNEIINAMEKTNIEVKAKLQEDFKVQMGHNLDEFEGKKNEINRSFDQVLIQLQTGLSMAPLGLDSYFS